MALALVWGLAASPFACRRSDDGPRGQSGSEAPPGTGGTQGSSNDENLPCPCGVDGVFLRVTLLASSGPVRRLRVEQVIHGATDRAAGDELEVEDFGELPCLYGSAPVSDGEQALALFRPADRSSCDAAPDAGDCPHDDGGVLLTPWADELLFAQIGGRELRVPASELPSLWSEDVDTCIERHGDVASLIEASSSAPRADEP